MIARRVLCALLFAVAFDSAFGFQRPVSVAEVARAVGPSVVVITTKDQDGKELKQGSGFMMSNDGLIATNVHVIDGAYSASVELGNGDIYDSVSVVDFDRRRDLALIRIKALHLPYIIPGDSDKLKVGEHLIAVGNPNGLTDTVSDGILSAVRQVEGLTLLQITAPISPGSSGGPVLNDAGKVVGVAQGKIDGENLNFAVPIKYLLPLIASSNAAKSMPLPEFNAGRLASATASEPGQSSTRPDAPIPPKTSAEPQQSKAGTEGRTSNVLDGAWSATIADAKTSGTLQFNLIQNEAGEVVGTYTTSLGGGGSIKGKLEGHNLAFELTQSIQGCAGIFKGSAQMDFDKAAGTYTGTDCLGDHGKGTLTITRNVQNASTPVQTPQQAIQPQAKVSVVDGNSIELRGARYVFVSAENNLPARNEIAMLLTKSGFSVVTDARQSDFGLVFSIQYSSQGQMAVADVIGQALRPNASGGLRRLWTYSDKLMRPSLNEQDIAKNFTKAFLKAYDRANK